MSGTSVLFMMDKVQGEQTNAVEGEYSPSDALGLMLAGTALRFVEDKAVNGFVVSRQSAVMHEVVGTVSPTPPPEKANPTVKDNKPKKLLSLLAAVAAAAGSTHAQETKTDSKNNEDYGEVISLSEFVVSGTITPKRPIDSPASITTIDNDAIKLMAPVGGPELLKSIPGFYVESAGGEARANVRTRGLASPGGYTYAGLQEDGMPVLGENRIRGTEPDMLTRLTTFVGHVEAIRGGASGIFQDSVPGGIVNFINREGSAARQSDLYLQTTDYGQIKVEAWNTGPISKNTTYAAYFGYRRDNGQKDAGFTANHGGSFIANVKRTFGDDRSYFKVTVKYLDEANLFWLPIPLKNASNPQTIPGGVDIKSGSLYSSALKKVFSRATPDGVLAPDLEKNAGRARTSYITGDLNLNLGNDWTLKNIARFTYVDYTSDLPTLSGVATPLQALANSIGAGAGSQFAAANSGTAQNPAYRYRLYSGGQLVANPSTLNSNGLGILQSLGQTFANIDNFQNDLRVIKATAPGSAIALGLYSSFLNTSFRAYGHTIVNSISPEAQPLDFEFVDAAGQSLGFGTSNGVRQMSAAASYRHATSSREQFSPYLNIEQTFGKWTVEIGARHEELMERVSTETAAAYDLNTSATGNNPALRSASFGSGVWQQHNFHLHDTIWTTALNYKFNEGLGGYVRYMDGYRMPLSGDMMNSMYNGTNNPGPTEKMQQIETGLKYATRKFSAFLTLIQTYQQNQNFVGNFAQPDGTIAQTNYFRSSHATSLETEIFYTPIKPLTLHLVSTLQKVEYSNTVLIASNQSPTGLVNLKGHRPVRVPKIFGTASAIYRFPKFRLGQPIANIDWEYIGQRYGDDGNFTNLPGYSQINLGLAFETGRVTYRAQVKNLTDQLGFTEGDPRTAQIVADPTATYMNMRTIYPRSFLFSVDIHF